MTLVVEAHEQCKKCFHFQVCASVLKNDLLIREVMLGEKEPRCKMFVDVVRCKDCDNTCPGSNGLVCTAWGARTDPDGWCYKAERKDE